MRALLDSLGSFPPYFLRLGEINRRGPGTAGRHPRNCPNCRWRRCFRCRRAGGQIIDVRPVTGFSAGHPRGRCPSRSGRRSRPGSGWLAPPDRPLVIVRDDDQDPDEIVWQAAKIGYDNLTGQVAGGMAGWRAAGAPEERLPLVTAEHIGRALVLDIRQAAEFTAGHVPGCGARRAR